MDIVIHGYSTQTIPSFCAKAVNITKEQILALKNQGKKEKEIAKLLGISLSTYHRKLEQFGLSTAYNPTLAKIPREEFEKMLQEHVPIDDICKKFNLTTNAYYTYIRRYNLRSYIMGANRNAVTKDKLQELVDKKLSMEEICKQLNISKHAYYDLLTEFNIITKDKSRSLNIKNITKEQLESLINSGKSYPEICEQLKISESTLQQLTKDFQINTKISQTKKITSGLTKEKLQELVDSGKTNAEICRELNIPIRTYTRLTKKFGIETAHRRGAKIMSGVTKESLQKLIDDGYTRKEICAFLNLSGETAFYKLLKRLGVRYNYVHHNNEINIPRKDLQNVVDEWESARDIQDKLDVSNTTFYEKTRAARVKTVLTDSIEKLKSLNIAEIQEKLDNGAEISEICEMYNITPNQYSTLVQSYGLASQTKKKYIEVQNITKEQLENLIKSGKMVKEICKELKISNTTYLSLLKKFGIQRT